jgi:hypothetical protein
MNYKKFIEGFGSILNILPTIESPQIIKDFKPIYSTMADDKETLMQDWCNIGNDIKKAMNEFKC